MELNLTGRISELSDDNLVLTLAREGPNEDVVLGATKLLQYQMI